MLTKTVILITVLFCAYSACVWGQTTRSSQFTRPLPTPAAQTCINALKKAGILNKCRNDSLSTWDPLKWGQEQGTLRELCCTAYGEIDCVKNATANSNLCDTPSKQAMQNHQSALLTWWQANSCAPIKYHDAMCDPTLYNYLPAPKPPQVANCFKKLYKQVNLCEDLAKRTWKVKPTDRTFSQSVCCSKFETNDCYVTVAQKNCNQTENTQFVQYYYSLNQNLTRTYCQDNGYRSFSCYNPNLAFPPPPPPKAANCTGKLTQMDACSNIASKKWNDNIKVLTGKNACCGNWDVFDCLLADAEDKCTLAELSEFEQYYNFLAQTIVKVNCSGFSYHSPLCKGSPHGGSNALHFSWIYSVITLILVLIFAKN